MCLSYVMLSSSCPSEMENLEINRKSVAGFAFLIAFRQLYF